ncbi:hypothetical protein [Salmonella enterica]|nr:hypothetical protein [Salmonella enterica]
MARYDLSDEAWTLIQPLLPAETSQHWDVGLDDAEWQWWFND